MKHKLQLVTRYHEEGDIENKKKILSVEPSARGRVAETSTCVHKQLKDRIETRSRSSFKKDIFEDPEKLAVRYEL